jgi:hypothetical protein
MKSDAEKNPAAVALGTASWEARKKGKTSQISGMSKLTLWSVIAAVASPAPLFNLKHRFEVEIAGTQRPGFKGYRQGQMALAV